MKVIVTCEHAAWAVPDEYRELFRPHLPLLYTHSGSDIGALNLSEAISSAFGAPLIRSEVSRLVVDLNRSIGHRDLFYRAVRQFGEDEKKRILNRYYFPYRMRVEKAILSRIAAGQRVLHLSVHSFTPVINGKVRKTDIGLLFDSNRRFERALCGAWRSSLRRLEPGWALHFNLPYRGAADGLTSSLRKRWKDGVYAGIELEVNQKLIIGKRASDLKRLREALIDGLRDALKGSTPS